MDFWDEMNKNDEFMLFEEEKEQTNLFAPKTPKTYDFEKTKRLLSVKLGVPLVVLIMRPLLSDIPDLILLMIFIPVYIFLIKWNSR